MKPLDWILLIVAIPLFLLNTWGYLVASADFRVRAGLAEPNAKPRTILFWFGVICFVLWRVWG